jgi:Tol biopolymer transport system component
VVERLMTNPTTGAAQFSVSDNGTLVYLQGEEWVPQRGLILTSGDGGSYQSLTARPRPFQSPRVSPDGGQIAVMLEAANDDIWIFDLQDDSAGTRLTFEAGSNVAPVWSPDGEEVAFSSNRSGPFNLYRKRVDGSRPAERLTTSERIQFATSWSPDGRYLAFIQVERETGPDVWVLDTESGDQTVVMNDVYAETGPGFSRDGRWLVYTSDETGTPEVYVRTFPGEGGKWQVSQDGGFDPVWSRDGRWLYYRSGDRLIQVEVIQSPSGVPEISPPETALDLGYELNPVNGIPNYDVTADRRFVLARSQPDLPREIHVVTNWFEDLKRLAPTE